jgi:threonine/homoserine/homoserine lactone efflux protein
MPGITLLSFALAAALLTVTPGLDTVLVLRTWLGQGRGAAVRAALGVQAGCFAWGCAVAAGLGAVLAAAPAAFDALRWCGALYLAWCGTQMLVKPRSSLAIDQPGPAKEGAFRRGLLTNLLNPKVGLFYLSFLPGFVPAGWPVAPTMVGLTTIHIGLALAWFGALLSGAGAVRTTITARAGLVRALDRLTGLVFVGFGLRLALERR